MFLNNWKPGENSWWVYLQKQKNNKWIVRHSTKIPDRMKKTGMTFPTSAMPAEKAYYIYLECSAFKKFVLYNKEAKDKLLTFAGKKYSTTTGTKS